MCVYNSSVQLRFLEQQVEKVKPELQLYGAAWEELVDAARNRSRSFDDLEVCIDSSISSDVLMLLSASVAGHGSGTAAIE